MWESCVFFPLHMSWPLGKHREVMWEGRDIDTRRRYHQGSQTAALTSSWGWLSGTHQCSIKNRSTAQEVLAVSADCKLVVRCKTNTDVKLMTLISAYDSPFQNYPPVSDTDTHARRAMHSPHWCQECAAAQHCSRGKHISTLALICHQQQLARQSPWCAA